MTTKHPPCCLTILMTGLSVALEEIALRARDRFPDLRAFLFSFEEKGVEFFITDLLELFIKVGARDYEWVWNRVEQYFIRPLAEREIFFEQFREYFEIHHQDISEGRFSYSVLSGEGRCLGEKVYEENRDFFIFLSTFIFDEWLKNGLLKDHHVVFFANPD